MPFDSNPDGCTFTIADGPEFLVGKVLEAAEVAGNDVYRWTGVSDVDAMFAFIGIDEPRCLDLAWYFRILEGGVMIGHPKGLTEIERIDQSGPDCVVLTTSSTNEYTTVP